MSLLLQIDIFINYGFVLTVGSVITLKEKWQNKNVILNTNFSQILLIKVISLFFMHMLQEVNPCFTTSLNF